MTRISHAFSLGLVFLSLAACGAAPAPPPSPAVNTMAPRERLSRIAERYWDEQASPANPLSPQYLADALAAGRRHLADLLAIPRAGLDPDSRLTYDILKRRLELDIEGFTYPAELLPVNPFDAMPLRLARIAADMAQPPLPAAKDYENWLLQTTTQAGRSRRLPICARECAAATPRRARSWRGCCPCCKFSARMPPPTCFICRCRMARGHASPRD
jgi:hypothetical protein